MLTRNMIVGMLMAVLVWISATSWATTYYVDPNGSDDANGLSWETAFATIQKGIVDSNDGDTVIAGDGVYKGVWNRHIQFFGKEVTVRSANGPENCIIDVEETAYYGFYIVGGEDSNSVLDGITIIKGSIGIVFANGSSPLIENCIIKDCGKGMHSYDSSKPIISGCVISDNGGDGIYWYGTSMTVSNCIFSGNSGKGVYCVSASDANITNCVIAKNGHGIYLHFSDGLTISNCTIVGNTTSGIYRNFGTQPTISNCILWANGDDLYDCNATYSCIEDGDIGTGNISSDPYFADYNSNDFHLTSDSPCINTGDPNGDYTAQTDIDGEPRVMRERVDMGADEFPRVHNITQNKWYVHINDAIGEADEGDEIEVYKGTFYETVDFNGVSCTVRSTDPYDSDVVGATVIDTENAGNGVIFNSGEDANSILTGFTIQNGYYGIDCLLASPTITNCTIKNSVRGGIILSLANPIIEYCIIESTSDIGMRIWGSPTIRYNIIRDKDNDGIFIRQSSASVKSNWIYNNGHYGVKIYDSNSSVLRNNTIVGNTAAGVYVDYGTEPSISNCILWDNGDDLYNCTATYSCIEDPNDANGVGNITSDPCFVNPDTNDFHLMWNSPCIDVGDPNVNYDGEKDIDGQPRLADGDADDTFVVDMGADEYLRVYNLDKWLGYINIQDAIDDANDGDEIVVYEGTYYESIDFDGKAITVRSTDPNDDDVVAATIIDANSDSNNPGRVVTFDDGEDANSVLTGFTITGGYVSYPGDGAGIYCYGSSPTISSCVIYDNNAGDDGGGISCDNSSSPSISYCLITSNEAGDGGGICCNNSSSPTISYCEITDNEADDKGGGIYCKANSCSTIKDCEIGSNSSYRGGGIYCNASEPKIERCIISDNGTTGGSEADGGGICCLSGNAGILNCIIIGNISDDDGGGIWCDGSDPNIINCTLTGNDADDKGGAIYCRNGSDPVITNCILWDDTAETKPEIYKTASNPVVTYSDIDVSPVYTGTGNINSDPCFADANTGDFHLDSDSPCIDAGDPNTDPNDVGLIDLDGNDRFVDGDGDANDVIDMGCYEYDPNS